MIKLQWDIEEVCSLSEVLCRPELIRALEKLGYNIGQHDKPDYVVAMANGLADVKPNTIAFEKLDGCQINNRKLLLNDNLLSLVKMYHYEDYKAYNTQCIGGRIFTRLLTDKGHSSKHIDPIMTDVLFKKVATGLNFLHYKRHDNLIKYADWFGERDMGRSTDVYFGGTTTYGDSTHKAGRVVAQHRRNAIDAIAKLDGYIVHTDNHRALGTIDYYSKLMDTKIVVSPWGWGEACYRDYEAIVLGCAVIKPYSGRIISNPDIYSDKYITWCKPDFSDLSNVVANIMDTYTETRGTRKANRHTLINARSFNYQATVINNIVEQAGRAR